MGLRPTQGDEKTPRSRNRSLWKLRPPLCHPACPGVPWDRSEPGFPASLRWTGARVRLSLRKLISATNLNRKSGVA
jgi:hypothetical protein